MTRSRLLVLLTVAVLAGGALCVVRVPGGQVLLSGRRVLEAGLRLAPPWSSRIRVPLAAERRLAAVPIAAGDGIELEADVYLRVTADTAGMELDPRLIAEDGGFDAHLARRAGEAVSAVLASHAGADPLLARMRALQAGAVAGALSAGGLTVTDVVVSWKESEAMRRLRRARVRGMRRDAGRRVLLVGLDGADWQVIDPLLDARQLPALAGLLRRGVRADLRSNDPMLSPLLWTTVATGKAPEEHGIIDFLLIEPETGRRVPMSSRFRKAKALWNILTDVGMDSAFVAWWATWPAERVDGTMVTDRVSYSLFAGLEMEAGESGAGLTFPPGYIAEVEDRLASPEDVTFEEIRRFLHVDRAEYDAGREALHAPPGAPPEHPVVALARVLAAARTYHALALDLLERGQPPLMAVYYEGIDQVGHRFQHMMPPRMEQVTEAEHRRYGDAVTAYYRYQDELLGELVSRADPETVFVLLSDHGFRNGPARPRDLAPYVSEKPGFWHRRYGMFALAGPGVRRGRIDTVTLYDIAPTVLHLLGLPDADDMRGRALVEALEEDAGAALRIASYEGFGDRHQAPAATAAASAIEDEMVRELTALGYLGSGALEGAAEPAVAPEGETRVTANYHLNLAAILAGQEKYDEAEVEVRAALAQAPLPDAFRLLSQIQERRGDLPGAIETARRALAVSGAEPGAGDAGRLRLVGLLLDAGRVEEARRAAGSSFAGAAAGSTARGLVAEKEGRKAEAAALYRQALEAEPTQAAALERLYRLVPPAQLATLAPLVHRALAENDRLAPFHNVLGVIRKSRGDIPGAIAAYRRALELEPDRVDYMANLGAAEMIRGDLDEALRVLERARRRDPESADVWLNLGSVHGKAGRPRTSLEAFARARELGAEGPGLAVGEVLGHAILGEMEIARRLLGEARARYPDDPTLRELESDLR